ncbi:hypothetical protein K3495_g2080 [Podosphaera aphanis]|nr:hypothetical protein K3495_g2080 [Podosphaera aphanis]
MRPSTKLSHPFGVSQLTGFWLKPEVSSQNSQSDEFSRCFFDQESVDLKRNPLTVKSPIIHLQPFGQEYFVHTPSSRRPSGSKVLPRAKKGSIQTVLREKRHNIISADVKFLPDGSQTLGEDLIAYPQMNRVIQSKSLTTDISSSHERRLTNNQNISSQDPNQADLTKFDQSPTSSIEITYYPKISSLINSRPKRSIHFHTLEDTITEEWWNPSRVLPKAVKSNSGSVNDREHAMAKIIDESEPKSYL